MCVGGRQAASGVRAATGIARDALKGVDEPPETRRHGRIKGQTHTHTKKNVNKKNYFKSFFYMFLFVIGFILFTFSFPSKIYLYRSRYV